MGFSCTYIDDPVSTKKGIIIAGGSIRNFDASFNFFATSYFFNLVTANWSRLGDLNTERSGAGRLIPLQVTTHKRQVCFQRFVRVKEMMFRENVGWLASGNRLRSL